MEEALVSDEIAVAVLQHEAMRKTALNLHSLPETIAVFLSMGTCFHLSQYVGWHHAKDFH